MLHKNNIIHMLIGKLSQKYIWLVSFNNFIIYNITQTQSKIVDTHAVVSEESEGNTLPCVIEHLNTHTMVTQHHFPYI